VVTNSLSFCFSEDVFIAPSFLKESFARYSILDWQFCFFKTVKISSPVLQVFCPRSLLSSKLKNPYMFYYFFLLLLWESSVFDLWEVDHNMSWGRLAWVELSGGLWPSCIFVPLSRVREFSIISLSVF
jgi:hypothetical protein